MQDAAHAHARAHARALALALAQAQAHAHCLRTQAHAYMPPHMRRQMHRHVVTCMRMHAHTRTHCVSQHVIREAFVRRQRGAHEFRQGFLEASRFASLRLLSLSLPISPCLASIRLPPPGFPFIPMSLSWLPILPYYPPRSFSLYLDVFTPPFYPPPSPPLSPPPCPPKSHRVPCRRPRRTRPTAPGRRPRSLGKGAVGYSRSPC